MEQINSDTGRHIWSVAHVSSPVPKSQKPDKFEQLHKQFDRMMEILCPLIIIFGSLFRVYIFDISYKSDVLWKSS
jgi:hypothetical protein